MEDGAPPPAESAASTGSKIRSFIEMCGRHPLATGIFALIGIFGLGFSFFTFAVDQMDAVKDAETTQTMQASMDRVENTVGALAPAAEPEQFDPISSHAEVNSLDNVVFPREHMGKSLEWIEANVPAAFGEIPVLGFSVKSMADSEYVQFAPYLVVDVLRIEPIGGNIAAIYHGERGDGGELRHFAGVLLPQTGYQFAPLIDSATGELRSGIDYFRLAPKEPEELRLDLSYSPDFVYTFRVGIHFRYKGADRIHWMGNTFRSGIPSRVLPLAGFENTDFKPAVHPSMEWLEPARLRARAASDRAAADAGAVFTPRRLASR